MNGNKFRRIYRNYSVLYAGRGDIIIKPRRNERPGYFWWRLSLHGKWALAWSGRPICRAVRSSRSSCACFFFFFFLFFWLGIAFLPEGEGLATLAVFISSSAAQQSSFPSKGKEKITKNKERQLQMGSLQGHDVPNRISLSEAWQRPTGKKKKTESQRSGATDGLRSLNWLSREI